MIRIRIVRAFRIIDNSISNRSVFWLFHLYFSPDQSYIRVYQFSIIVFSIFNKIVLYLIVNSLTLRFLCIHVQILVANYLSRSFALKLLWTIGISWIWKRTKFLRVLRFQMRSVCPVVFPISSLSFITISFDFYVSISKHARASSPPINSARRLGPTIPATRERWEHNPRERSHICTQIFIDSGPCMRVR